MNTDDLAAAWEKELEAEGDAPVETATAPPASAEAVLEGVDADALAKALPGGDENLGLLLDVPVTISVEIGRTSLPIKEVLALGPGSIVSLGKMAGEPMDLLVNGKKIAQGEIVIVDESFGIRDSFGIRVTSIVDNFAR